jgi:hypothetical protein
MRQTRAQLEAEIHELRAYERLYCYKRDERLCVRFGAPFTVDGVAAYIGGNVSVKVYGWLASHGGVCEVTYKDQGDDGSEYTHVRWFEGYCRSLREGSLTEKAFHDRLWAARRSLYEAHDAATGN